MTDPKLASGSAWQLYWLMHSEGASRIHSAELTSIAEVWRVLRKLRWLVRLSSSTTTFDPVTVTLACIASPGCTASEIVLEGAGTNSYQALETTLPAALQSSSVPICSSASEVGL